MGDFPSLATTPLITDLLARNMPVAIGVSGGKDSDVAAFETQAYLKAAGHSGPVILIHSDLGRVEHRASLPACQRLAERLGLELVVVRRQAGDLLDRWRVRWHHNVERYRQLECVKLILPWSTPAMRFCTSELKTAVICRSLVERFAGQTILSVAGIRREESSTRAHAPIAAAQPRLSSATFGTSGYTWHPLLDWTREQVLAYHRVVDFPLHEAYSRYGMSRVSCAFCILSSASDLVASATNPDNHAIYRQLVELEIISTFSFQPERWLGDVAPHLLSGEMQARLSEAKRRARLRELAEASIPRSLWYTKGWPITLPTPEEARLLGEVRRRVADIMQWPSLPYTEADAIGERYANLMALHLHASRKTTVSITREGRQAIPGLWDTI